MKRFTVYILASDKNGTLYIGVTSNLLKRIENHRYKMKGFTAKYDVTRLVYFEFLENAEEAIHREKRLKKYTRVQKIKLIEGLNPQWRDLIEDIAYG